MNQYTEFRRRILSAETMEELNAIRAEYQAADLSDDDKYILGCNLRTRFGNHVQLKGD